MSTLETGFSIAHVEAEPGEDDAALPEALGINPDGYVFAVFRRDRTTRVARNLSRAETEALDGMRRVVLGWEQ